MFLSTIYVSTTYVPYIYHNHIHTTHVPHIYRICRYVPHNEVPYVEIPHIQHHITHWYITAHCLLLPKTFAYSRIPIALFATHLGVLHFDSNQSILELSLKLKLDTDWPLPWIMHQSSNKLVPPLVCWVYKNKICHYSFSFRSVCQRLATSLNRNNATPTAKLMVPVHITCPPPNLYGTIHDTGTPLSILIW